MPLDALTSLTGGGGLSSSSSAAGKSGDITDAGTVTYNYSGATVNKTNMTPFIWFGLGLVAFMVARKRRLI